MKITKNQLKRIIAEQIATIDKEAIEDTVMGVLSDEGGAAGIDPIEDALEDLEDEDISLPDEDIEDVIKSVAGVKRHVDGDYVDTTQLEVRKSFRNLVNEIVAEIEGKIICPACGHANSPGVKKCSNCGHPRSEGKWKEV